MRKSRAPALREQLRGDLADGASASALARAIGLQGAQAVRAVHAALRSMPDAYIDRWDETTAPMTAIWCVVVPPPHMEKPKRTPTRKRAPRRKRA